MPASDKDRLAHLLSRTRATPSGCLVWLGYIEKNGYGRASVKNVTDRVHRHVYRLAIGQIPDGLEIRHRCNNRLCIKIEHLFSAEFYRGERPLADRVSIDTTALHNLYIVEKKSIYDIAKILLLPPSTTRQVLLNAGIKLRSRIDGFRLAHSKLGKHSLGKKVVFSKERRDKLTAGIRAFHALHARGVSLKPNGYMEITRGPNKYRHVHLVLMEEHIGRRLTKDEVVHHIDHNKLNNDISNLQLMTRSAHMSLHMKERLSKNGQS